MKRSMIRTSRAIPVFRSLEQNVNKRFMWSSRAGAPTSPHTCVSNNFVNVTFVHSARNAYMRNPDWTSCGVFRSANRAHSPGGIRCRVVQKPSAIFGLRHRSRWEDARETIRGSVRLTRENSVKIRPTINFVCRFANPFWMRDTSSTTAKRSMQSRNSVSLRISSSDMKRHCKHFSIVQKFAKKIKVFVDTGKINLA